MGIGGSCAHNVANSRVKTHVLKHRSIQSVVCTYEKTPHGNFSYIWHRASRRSRRANIFAVK